LTDRRILRRVGVVGEVGAGGQGVGVLDAEVLLVCLEDCQVRLRAAA
jgi:hypothetical protein